MHRVIWSVIFFSLQFLMASDPVEFTRFFEDRTLRIDYYHIGDAVTEIFTIDQIYQQVRWAGNPRQLIDEFNNGRYYYKLYDLTTNRLIYSKGFDSYFSEYQTTTPAHQQVKRTYHETALTPYPKRPVLFVIEKRNRQKVLQLVFKKEIDPGDYHIIKEGAGRGDKILKIRDNGDPHQKVDLAIIGEGYTQRERRKFKQDLNKYTDMLFSIEPFQSYQDHFNVYGIFSPSMESGVDRPTHGVYKNTVLNASFNALDTPRYLLTEDNRTLQDIAAQVPSDVICIMANENRYGGGGIYNFFSIFTAGDVKWNEYVFIHEFGHSFAGLADEYYSSQVAYNDFYPQGVEPTEPNITALLDPELLKWRDLVTPGLEIPTPWGKSEYDSLSQTVGHLRAEKQKRTRQLVLQHVKTDSIEQIEEEFDNRIAAARQKTKRFVSQHPLKGKIGAFEGAGYRSEGLFRPTLNSIMNQFTGEDRHFYTVNEQAIIHIIKHYTE